MALMPLFIILLMVAYAFISSMIPVVIGAALMFLVILILFGVFQRREGDTEKTADLKRFSKILCSGMVVLIPGIIICVRSSKSYYALFTHTLVYGGPRPGGILLVIAGVIIIIASLVLYRPK